MAGWDQPPTIRRGCVRMRATFTLRELHSVTKVAWGLGRSSTSRFPSRRCTLWAQVAASSPGATQGLRRIYALLRTGFHSMLDDLDKSELRVEWWRQIVAGGFLANAHAETDRTPCHRGLARALYAMVTKLRTNGFRQNSERFRVFL
jgi:hypothetical protein